jgi:hypothetical protein
MGTFTTFVFDGDYASAFTLDEIKLRDDAKELR